MIGLMVYCGLLVIGIVVASWIDDILTENSKGFTNGSNRAD